MNIANKTSLYIDLISMDPLVYEPVELYESILCDTYV